MKPNIQELTMDEKIALLSGLDFWNTKSFKDVPSVMMTDGPHGLRKQEMSKDHLGLAHSVPATCYPTAATTANSFDPELLEEIGAALGEECKVNGVSALLGPALNIKRSPLCGRNFEYFSEDPLVSGVMAAGLVKGIQEQKVGSVIKHFAVNNQESGRMVSDSIVDERTLREIYLAGFEYVVKNAAPVAVMGAYNKLNGTYCCENKTLLTDILRKEWNYEGFVVTDWGAVNDRVAGINAGCDLEMPTDSGYHAAEINKAMKKKQLAPEQIEQCADRIADFAVRYAVAPDNQSNLVQSNPDQSSSDQSNSDQSSSDQSSPDQSDKMAQSKHHELARKAARESAVLLKNNGLLPFKKDAKLLVIGEFAKSARYQGAGSSQINPARLNQLCDELDKNKIEYSYAKGYEASNGSSTEELISEAVEKAKSAEQILMVLGLPAVYESEGFDRKNMSLPQAHNELAEAVLKVNKNVCVLIMTGGAVLLPWRKDAAAILNMNLSGQNVGGAAYDLLFGDYSPCGKLAESYPENEQSVPSAPWFGGADRTVTYFEGLYVGYRYYDTVDINVAYPFGYGLSYTDFEYNDLVCSKELLYAGESLEVSFELTNAGDMEAKEIVQLYVRAPQSVIYKPVHELKAFTKVSLKPHESRRVTMNLDTRAFSYWNRIMHNWSVEGGSYVIEIAASSRDIRLRKQIQIETEELQVVPDDRKIIPGYYLKKDDIIRVEKTQFEALLGYCIPKEIPQRPFTINSTLKEIQSTKFGRKINEKIHKQSSEAFSIEGEKKELFEKMMNAMLDDLPLRALGLMSGGMMTPKQVEGMVDMLNKHYIRGIKKMKK